MNVEAVGKAVLLGKCMKKRNLTGRVVAGEDEVSVLTLAFFLQAFQGGAESEEERLKVGFTEGIEATDVEGEEAVERKAKSFASEPFLIGGGGMEVIGIYRIGNDFVAKRDWILAHFGFESFGNTGEDVELGLTRDLSGADGGIARVEVAKEVVEEGQLLE
jgi:hypothetical protein